MLSVVLTIFTVFVKHILICKAPKPRVIFTILLYRMLNSVGAVFTTGATFISLNCGVNTVLLM